MPLTDLWGFLKVGADWPPKSERARLNRYAQNRKLWAGRHDEVYGNWWKLLREDKQASLELVFNWHRRVSKLWADLLLGEPPRFFAGPKGSDEQLAVDRITGVRQNAFASTLYEAVVDVSRYGDGLLKIRLGPKGAEISAQPPSYWFPVVYPNDLRKVKAHVLAWTFEQEDAAGQKVKYLWAEIHEKGRIENRVYRLERNQIAGRMAPALFDPERPEVEETGVEEFLIVPVPGLRASDEMFGADDYEDLDSVVSALEVRAGQINRILDKHSDPSMYGPPEYAGVDPDTGEPLYEAGGRYFQVEDGDVPPDYIVWDGKLEAQFREIETLMEQLYIISETSPAAFGQLKHGLAESGSALRRLMQAPLVKASRLRMRLDPAAVRALKLAAELERANGRDTPALEKLLIQWQDGLPPDPREMADTEAVRVHSTTSSRASAIRRLDGGTQEEAEAELERAMKEREALAEVEVNRPPSRPGDMSAEGGSVERKRQRSGAEPPEQRPDTRRG